jgi:two-component system chemotaxis sensor kinase CheA
VLIRVADDGAGLDRERILAKAIERGLLPPGADPPENEVFRLIFEPGFSTARQVTEISGRGVGLDVVERGVSALRGSVEVRSRRGEGTTFTLKLPLTLAIIDGLLVKVGADHFVLPVANILECVELRRSETAVGRRTVIVRNEMIPYIPLREYFGIPGETPEISQVMLAETEMGKFGFAVDNVIGDHQTVIKSLGRVCRNVESISGATILGDGAVALILDLDKLVKDVIRHA